MSSKLTDTDSHTRFVVTSLPRQTSPIRRTIPGSRPGFGTLADVAPLEWTEGHTVRVATAEGLILTQMVAFQAQDQMDIETLLTVYRDEIDVDLIREEWFPFAVTDAERTAWLEAAIARRVVRRE
jgi:hypothetical protein